MSFVTIPPQGSSSHFRRCKVVTLHQTTPDPCGFFESVLGFAEFGGNYFRVSVSDQKRFFNGRVPFGKCAIRVKENGHIEIIKTKDFGRDWDTQELYFDHSIGEFRSVFDDRVILRPAIF